MSKYGDCFLEMCATFHHGFYQQFYMHYVTIITN